MNSNSWKPVCLVRKQLAVLSKAEFSSQVSSESQVWYSHWQHTELSSPVSSDQGVPHKLAAVGRKLSGPDGSCGAALVLPGGFTAAFAKVQYQDRVISKTGTAQGELAPGWGLLPADQTFIWPSGQCSCPAFKEWNRVRGHTQRCLKRGHQQLTALLGGAVLVWIFGRGLFLPFWGAFLLF